MMKHYSRLMSVGTLMLLGTNQFFDRNSHCTCTIFCINLVAIIIHVVSKFQADGVADKVVHRDYFGEVAIFVHHTFLS